MLKKEYKNYKYIHVFWCDEIKFSPRVVRLICDPNNGFDSTEHLFITPHQRVFDALKSSANIELVHTKKPYSADVVNRVAPYCDWMFLHSMPALSFSTFIKKKHRKKIIWRTWGHDVYRPSTQAFYKRWAKHILYLLWKPMVKSFRAVGIANAVDEINLKRVVGDLCTYPIPYAEKDGILNSPLVDCTDMFSEQDEAIKILVGHSGHRHDNHIQIMNRLQKFKQENIRLYFVLSYGDKENIKAIKAHIHDHWKDKAVIIEEMLPYKKFASFLSHMDIAFLDGTPSYALGNVALLLHFRKKIFLNRNGIIKQAFDAEGLPYSCSDEIDHMSFEELCAPVQYEKYPNYSHSSMLPQQYEVYVQRWHKLLRDLDGSK